MAVLKIYDYSNYENAIPVTVENDKCYCIHNANGADQLKFELQKASDGYGYIYEEVKVECFSNRFVIKKIEEQSDFVVVTCELDYDDWLEDIYLDYRETNINLPSVLATILPTNWSVSYGDGVDIISRTTVEYQEGVPFRAANAKTILDVIGATYGVVFNYDTINKILYVINMSFYSPSGDYFIEDLNMSNLKFIGDSSNFITRLYVYGKKDETTGEYLNIASINDGKEYLEDTSYSDKIISDSVVDERYTVVENLKAYGESILAERSIPKRSYTFDIENNDGTIYLYKVVTIVDKTKGLRLNHQCIKYTEYVDHSYDTVTLSSVAPSIDTVLNSVSSGQAVITGRVNTNEINIAAVSELMLGTSGGYFKWILDSSGNKKEFLILLDSTSIGTANKLFKLDDNGLHYSSTGYNGTYTTILNDNGLVTAASSAYPDLQGKPQINGVTLVGNKTLSDLNFNPLTTAEIEAILV